jgi:calpain-7
MASSAWQKKLQEAQDLANKGAKCEISKDYSTAFQCYVRAGETYLWLVREAIGPRDTTRLRAAAEKVLSRAETIKRVKSDVQNVPRRLLSDEEQARALEVGSRVDSSKLLEWSQNCCSAPVLHTQRPLPALAPKQISQNALYQKMSELSPSVSNLLYDRKRPIRGSQIAQRVVTDCSFVAALMIAAEHDAKWDTSVSALYTI